MKKNLLKLTMIILSFGFAKIINAQCPTITITPTSAALQCGVIPPTFTANTTPSTNVTWQWLQPSGPTLLGQTCKPGSAGIYTFSATNNIGGCTSTQTVAVTSAATIPAMTISAMSNNYYVTCVTCVTMQITAMVQGGGGVGVRWMDASGTNTLTTSNTFSTCIPSNYMAFAYNLAAPNCSAAIVLSVMSNTTPPNVSFSSVNWGTNSPTLTCTNPSVVLTGSSTASSYSVSWQVPATIPSPTISMGVTTNTAQTIVATPSVVITNLINGCISKLAVPVYQNIVPPTLAINATPSVICVGQTGSLTASGSASNYTWSTGSNAPTIVVSPTVATNYSVTNTNTSNGCTKTAIFSVSSCLGINEKAEKTFGLNLYPNPNNGHFNFSIAATISNAEVHIVNIIGQTVFTAKAATGNNIMDVSHLAKGLYHCILFENKHAVSTVRLIVE